MSYMRTLLMVGRNGCTASGHPRSGSLACLDSCLDQVLGIPLRLATSTKRRIVPVTLPERVTARTPLKTPVSAYETLFLRPSGYLRAPRQPGQSESVPVITGTDSH